MGLQEPPLVCPAPRIAAACSACRARKTRCLPSDKAGLCRRCENLNLSCVVYTRSIPRKRGRERQPDDDSLLQPDSLPSPKRVHLRKSDEGTKQSPIELDQTEPNDFLSGLFSMPAQRPASTDSAGVQSFHQRLFTWLFPGRPAKAASHEPPVNVTAAPSGRVSLSLPSLGVREVEGYLREFHALHDYFPFVTLPSNYSAHSMRRHHPFLLLGILCAMSTKDIGQNQRLDTEFRRVLSEKTVIKNEISLDILQGLLVYSAWYPMHLYPRRRQFSQFLQMAMNMIQEMHLDSPSDALSEDVGPTAKSQDDSDGDKALTDGTRAYLGCYYLSSAIALGMNKTNYVAYTDYVDHCVTELGKNLSSRADCLIAWYVKLQRIAEEGAQMHSHKGRSTSNIEAHIASLKFQLANMRNMIGAVQTIPLRLAFSFAAMQIHAENPIRKPSRQQIIAGNASSNQPPSKAHGYILSECLQWTKSVFEGLLSLSSAEYGNFCIAEWAKMTASITIMFPLCFSIPSAPEWNDVAAREKAQFGMYLECLCFRMQELSIAEKESNSTVPTPDIFSLFKTVLQIVKRMYEDRVALVTKQQQQQHAQQTMNQPNAVLDDVSSLPRCPMFTADMRNTEYWDILQNYNFGEINMDRIGNETWDDVDFAALNDDFIENSKNWTAI